jgi:hypothetical protein
VSVAPASTLIKKGKSKENLLKISLDLESELRYKTSSPDSAKLEKSGDALTARRSLFMFALGWKFGGQIKIIINQKVS